MKSVFYHDTKFKYDNKVRYYTSSGLTNNIFQKYIDSFGSLTVVARKEPVEKDFNKTAYNHIGHHDITFNCINKLTILSLFLGKDRKLIKRALHDADFAIIRMPSIVGISAWLEVKKSKKPYMVEMVGCPWDALWNYGKLKYKLAAPVIYLINRLVIRRSSNVMYVSSNFLQERYPTNGNAYSCSDVELPELVQRNLKERIRRIESMDIKTPLKIGTVANVNMKYKGQDYVIKAIAALQQQGFVFHYYLVGGGDKTYLTKIAHEYHVEKRVHFMGSMAHGDIFDFLKELDIYVQPSNAEAVSRVILEAFSTACPVIGSSTGGTPEIVDSRYVFKRKDSNDLANRLSLISSSVELHKQAIRNFNEASLFSSNKLDSKRRSIYRKILRSKK